MRDDDKLLRLLLAENTPVTRRAQGQGDAPATPLRHLVAGLVADDPEPHLRAAAALARTTRDRQLVAICTAHLDGDADRLAVLVRDHLVDHPDSLLAAWVASRPTSGSNDATSPRIQSTTQPTQHQE